MAAHRLPQLESQARLKTDDRAGNGEVQAADTALPILRSTARHRNRKYFLTLVPNWIRETCVFPSEQEHIARLERHVLQGFTPASAAADQP